MVFSELYNVENQQRHATFEHKSECIDLVLEIEGILRHTKGIELTERN